MLITNACRTGTTANRRRAGQARLESPISNATAWADLAVHAPDEVWIAAMFERERANGLFLCAWRTYDNGLTTARPE
ncbi:hypothetical protein ABT124_15740 [Streptomyces sp. NPDC001982]|uniref:hypothetical protein n=1 Tax=Streptomyces sp. NPDC001982 TaxID=3154405 RepID=UPI003318772A